jgi:hypothetical protein
LTIHLEQQIENIMSIAINEMVEIFGSEGAMIFSQSSFIHHIILSETTILERPLCGPNLFHIVCCTTIKEAHSCGGEPKPVIKVLVVTKDVHLYPDLLTGILLT